MRRIVHATFTSLLLAGAGAAAAPAAATPQAVAADPTECDRLAGHPSDPDKAGAGVPAAQVRQWIESAIATCAREVAAAPDAHRLRYNLGRALFYRGRHAEGVRELERASAGGHRQAQFVLGLLYADGVPDLLPADPCRALPLWQDAAARGHYAARIGVARDAVRGAYAGCAGGPPRAQLREWLAAVLPEARRDWYQRLLVEDLLAALERGE